MDVVIEKFQGIDLGTYSSLRLVGQKVPELADVMRHSALAGQFLWLLFLAILAWRWWAIEGRFPTGKLLRVLLIIAVVEAIRLLIDRPRPDDAQDILGSPDAPRALFGFLANGGGFPNGPTFRAVLISALMWETTSAGWGRWLGLVGAVLYCSWVMMAQLLSHLAFLSDVLGSLALALAIGFLSPRILGRQSPSG